MKKALTALSAFLILTALFVPAKTFAARNLSEMCNIIDRPSIRHEAKRRILTRRLLTELDELCKVSTPPSLSRTGRQRESVVNPDMPSPSFPFSRSSYRTRNIPNCPLNTPPIEIVCGDAVPRTCTWLCFVGDELRRYPKR
jgi:hypothetical protein